MTGQIRFKCRLYHVFLLILSLLILISCAKPDETELPDFSKVNWESSYDVILKLNAQGRSGQITLFTRSDPGEIMMSVNGLSAQVQSMVFDYGNSFYTTRIFSDQINLGAYQEYQLDFAGGHSSGFFKVPGPLAPVFPIFGEGDYYFEWTSPSAPDLYFTEFSWVLNSVPGLLREQFSGSALSHRIKAQLWGGGVIYPEYLNIHAVNLSQSEPGFLVYAESVAEKRF